MGIISRCSNLSSVNSVHKKLTVAESQQLAQLLRAEPNIVGYSLADWQRFSGVQASTIDGQLAAVSLVHQLSPQWQELAVLYVAPDYRKQGLGKELLDAVSVEARATKQRIVVITRTPVMVKMIERAGYHPTSFSALPLIVKWQLATNELRLYRLKEVVRKSVRFGLRGGWKYYTL